jgi:hypothetical protein
MENVGNKDSWSEEEGVLARIRIQDQDINIESAFRALDRDFDSVQLADFKSVIELPIAPQWKQSAQQQLGFLLSRSFPDIASSFESISQFSGKLTFAQFQGYIQQRNALAEFNLTAELLQQLYADMNMHRKGYLTLQDWTLAFAAHRWKEQHYKELTDAMRVNFGDVHRAFAYFQGLQVTGKLDMEGFSRGGGKASAKAV